MKTVWFGDVQVQLKAVGFDKDGTLFDAVSFWAYIDQLRCSEFSKIVGPGYEQDWHTLMGWRHYPDDIDYNGTLAIATMAEEIILAAGLIYQKTGWPWFQCKQLAEQVFAKADQSMVIAEAFSKKPGVPEVIINLKQHGVNTGILTSDSFMRTEACMKLLQVDELLDFVITPEKVKYGKPNPDMVESCCSMFNILPSELAVVGDSIVDLKMAKAAGSIAVGLVTHEGSRESLGEWADILIESMMDIRVEQD